MFSVSVDVSAASLVAVGGSVVGAAVVVFTIVAAVSAVSVELSVSVFVVTSFVALVAKVVVSFVGLDEALAVVFSSAGGDSLVSVGASVGVCVVSVVVSVSAVVGVSVVVSSVAVAVSVGSSATVSVSLVVVSDLASVVGVWVLLDVFSLDDSAVSDGAVVSPIVSGFFVIGDNSVSSVDAALAATDAELLPDPVTVIVPV